MRPGDVVQINPEHDTRFGGCFLLITEVKSWGVQGFVQIPTSDGFNRAYYRVPFDQIEHIGTANWIPTDEVEA